jgi:hypothetical protein
LGLGGEREVAVDDGGSYGLGATPDSDVATVGPLDQRGELGLERVFFLITGGGRRRSGDRGSGR